MSRLLARSLKYARCGKTWSARPLKTAETAPANRKAESRSQLSGAANNLGNKRHSNLVNRTAGNRVKALLPARVARWAETVRATVHWAASGAPEAAAVGT